LFFIAQILKEIAYILSVFAKFLSQPGFPKESEAGTCAVSLCRQHPGKKPPIRYRVTVNT
ncbi:MAG: hypothetical protein Q4F57_09800, partial [Weeksellaceae bacterium]|nr:hypothetical protein [Weeksellaceae bacterium]